MNATTHDYTRSTWGHDYTIMDVKDGGKTISIMGWGEGIKKGDFIIIPNGDGTTRYRMKEIEYMRDPADMWGATAEFAPRPL